MENLFLETERMTIRKMSIEDYLDVAEMLKNSFVMYAWEYRFEDIDVLEWIRKNIGLYEKYDLGYFLAIDKNLNKVVGQIALIPDNINGKDYLEIGYILKEEFWGHGYAKEGALAIVNYAFKNLNKTEVIFEIRPNNDKSKRVAESLGAKVEGSFKKNVRGKEMEHLIYKLYSW